MRYKLVCQVWHPSQIPNLPKFGKMFSLTTTYALVSIATTELEAKLLRMRWRSVLRCSVIKTLLVPVP